MTVLAVNRGLESANKIRRHRSAKKRDVHAMGKFAGRDAVADLLIDPPAWLESCPIGELLRWPRCTLPATVNRWLARAEANHMARVAGPYAHRSSHLNPAVLSERQRAILAACLRGEL